MASYEISLWKLDIKYKLDKLNPILEVINFVCEDKKTGKDYEQSYKLSELFEKYKILSVYPNMFQSIIKNKIPNVDFKNDNAIVEWELEIPFEENEIIKLCIEEKSKDGLSDEFVELQQSNKLLRIKNNELESKVKKIEGDLELVMKELETIKIILLKCPNVFLSTTLVYPELVKTFINYGISITNHSGIHTTVKSIIVGFYGKDPKQIETNEYKFVKELIKHGYSTTYLNIKSAEGSGWSYKPTMISVLACYVLLQLGIQDENGFSSFKKVIELVLPTADLNIKYGEGGTIIDLCKKYKEKSINHLTDVGSRGYGNQSETIRLVTTSVNRYIEYLESLGAI